MISRMRALSSSVDFLVPVATTVMPRSCSAETTDQDLTPPVYSSTRLPFRRSAQGASAASIQASSWTIMASVRRVRSASPNRRAKSRKACEVSVMP